MYNQEEKFDFPLDMDTNEVLEWIGLATIDAQQDYGAKGLQTLQYTVQDKERKVCIDVSNDVGKHVAKVFKGLVEVAKSTKRWQEDMEDRYESPETEGRVLVNGSWV